MGQWSGDYCADGAPNGYGAFEAGDEDSITGTKATGKSKDYQFEAYPTGSWRKQRQRRLYYSQCMEL